MAESVAVAAIRTVAARLTGGVFLGAISRAVRRLLRALLAYGILSASVLVTVSAAGPWGLTGRSWLACVLGNVSAFRSGLRGVLGGLLRICGTAMLAVATMMPSAAMTGTAVLPGGTLRATIGCGNVCRCAFAGGGGSFFLNVYSH